MSELTHEDVRKILQIIDEIGDRDIHLEIGDLKLHVTRDGHALGEATPQEQAGPASPPPARSAAPAPAPAPVADQASPAPQPDGAWQVPEGVVAVRAPSIGTFYRASSPGAKPFVEVGSRVAPDDIVCVFDVMKLFSSLSAGVAGTVTAILVENQTVVQQDQPLILIKPD
jgi:acetyl-CoA carboxylase biotin carboxyl carrier protein